MSRAESRRDEGGRPAGGVDDGGVPGQAVWHAWILDTKYLFYNKDMLAKAGIAAPPKTWDELTEQAKIIKEKGIVEYPIVWSWAQAEAVIWTTPHFCRPMAAASSMPRASLSSTKRRAQALEYMTASMEAGITNPNSKEYLEEDVRRVFQNGEAAFALNWTYMFNLANAGDDSKVKGQVGVAPAPGVAGVSEVSAMNGSMGLGVTATSQNPMSPGTTSRT